MALIRPEDEAAHQAERTYNFEIYPNRQDLRHADQVDWSRLGLYLVESFRSGYRAANPDRRSARESLSYRWPVTEEHRIAAEASAWAAIYEIVGDNSFTLDVTADRNTLWVELGPKVKKQ